MGCASGTGPAKCEKYILCQILDHPTSAPHNHNHGYSTSAPHNNYPNNNYWHSTTWAPHNHNQWHSTSAPHNNYPNNNYWHSTTSAPYDQSKNNDGSACAEGTKMEDGKCVINYSGLKEMCYMASKNDWGWTCKSLSQCPAPSPFHN